MVVVGDDVVDVGAVAADVGAADVVCGVDAGGVVDANDDTSDSAGAYAIVADADTVGGAVDDDCFFFSR